MNVLFYCGHPDISPHDRSGAGTHIRGVVGALEEMGHKVELLFAAGTDVQREGMPEIRTGTRPLQRVRNRAPFIWQTLRDVRIMKASARANRALAQRLEDGSIDLVYERATYLQGGSTALTRSRGVPHILEYNSPLVVERVELGGRSALNGIGVWRERRLVKHATGVVAVSSSLRDDLRERIPESPEIVVAPNAGEIDWASLRPPRMSSNQLRIGFLGSMISWHRLDLLVEAFALLLADGFDAELVLIGSGHMLEPTLELAAQLGLQDSVVSLGHLDQKDARAALLDMDVAVLPANKWYGSPTKLLEYAAAQVAIIAPNEPGTRDLFEHGKTALLVDPDVQSVYVALISLARSPELRIAIAAAARELAESWSWSDVVERTLGLMDEAPQS